MKRFKVEWSRPASKDLLNVIEYISRESIDAAIRGVGGQVLFLAEINRNSGSIL